MAKLIQISGDRATAGSTLGSILDSLESRKPLHSALGKRAEIELREHFLNREQEPNKSGWPKQHFWSRIRSATAFRAADDTGATVGIAYPAIAQKIYGGTITPKEGKYLTIPAIAEAYGKSARSFDFLQLRRFKSGALALVENDRTQIKIGRQRRDGSRSVKETGQAQRGRVFYWLVRSVTQSADRRALPEEARIQEALLEETREYLARATGGA